MLITEIEMQLLKLIEALAVKDESTKAVLIDSNTFREEETTSLEVKIFAVVATNNEVLGFNIESTLYNHYAYSNECPCLVEQSVYLEFPTVQGDELNSLINEFVIDFQSKLFSNILNSPNCDSPRDSEIEVFDQWDRIELLEPPEEISELVSYIGLTKWAAINLEDQIKTIIATAGAH